MPEPLQRLLDGCRERLLVLEVAGVGKAHAQCPDALDRLVVDLARPACALALARLHSVAQAFDLDRALGREPGRDAVCEGVQRLAVGLAERAVTAQRDRQAAALSLHRERLDQHRARLEAEFVQERGLLAPRAIERERLALRVERTQRAALHGRDPQPHGPAAGARDAQLALLLDQQQHVARVEQGETAVRHQPKQPEL